MYNTIIDPAGTTESITRAESPKTVLGALLQVQDAIFVNPAKPVR